MKTISIDIDIDDRYRLLNLIKKIKQEKDKDISKVQINFFIGIKKWNKWQITASKHNIEKYYFFTQIFSQKFTQEI